MAQTPGFVFMVVDSRGATAGHTLPNGHAAPAMIDARPEPKPQFGADPQADQGEASITVFPEMGPDTK
jgi:hypothetical protein